jgi:outer membrane protein OmpA-like peptidoglycan-associated protein
LLQTKLKISEPGDAYEQEADRIADEVMRMPEPSVQRQMEMEEEAEEEEEIVQRQAISGQITPLIQRQGLPEMEEDEEGMVQRKEITNQLAPSDPEQESSEVPSIVQEALNSPDQPLDPETLAFMESRFKHDFSQVRVHSNPVAEQSAQDMNAHAYTMGQDIVFGRGQFAPETYAGRRLLAHELTHVVQQSSADKDYVSESNKKYSHFPNALLNVVELQKQNELKRETKPEVTTSVRLMLAGDWNPCGIEEDCPPRESGERSRAASATLQVGTLNVPQVGEIISHFGIGSSSVRGLARNPIWRSFVALIGSENSRWEILGFSDCEGSVERNTQLRQQRADAVFQTLPITARAKIDRVVSASLNDCVGTNDTEWERSLNRSVVFRRTSTTINFEDEIVEVTPPSFVCGPDVTSQIAASVAAIETTFAGWSADQKEDACDALDSLRTGGCAWDIVELHNNAWIHQNYRPPCATQGATPACGSSVQVGRHCYYAGSPNYVIFGKMCRLCANYYLSIPLINTGYARFTKSAMRNLINLYKGSGFSGFATPSGNFRESVAWADAGYDGWPSGGSPPVGDRSNCTPICPLPYTGPSFRVNWAPHQFFTGRCG